jgi:hypothetical protein
MAGLRHVKPAIAGLIADRAYLLALDAIDETETIIRRDLPGVHAVL